MEPGNGDLLKPTDEPGPELVLTESDRLDEEIAARRNEEDGDSLDRLTERTTELPDFDGDETTEKLVPNDALARIREAGAKAREDALLREQDQGNPRNKDELRSEASANDAMRENSQREAA